jgi:eukaryotic-like serine/threonine-protein kinase
VEATIWAERYQVEECLSATPMAEVITATDLVLDRRVVVKLLAPNADRLRFEREAHTAASLAHANIVQLFDYGEHAGRPYIVFECLAGGSLDQRLADGAPLSTSDVTRIATDIASGLAHAHDRGVVHRDLKPANVLFDSEDRAKLADFGIAVLGGAATLTEEGTVLGTAAYISPEQANGEVVTPASDVYSFGVLLYRLLAGRLPFEGDNAIELAAMHVSVEPPPLGELRADISPRLAALAMAAIAKRPEERPRDGASLLAALESSPSPPSVADADTAIRPPRAYRGRWQGRRLLAGAALALAAIAGAFAAVVLDRGTPSAPATPAGGKGSQLETAHAASRETSNRASVTTTARTHSTSRVTTHAPVRTATAPAGEITTPTASVPTETGGSTTSTNDTTTTVEVTTTAP